MVFLLTLRGACVPFQKVQDGASGVENLASRHDIGDRGVGSSAGASCDGQNDWRCSEELRDLDGDVVQSIYRSGRGLRMGGRAPGLRLLVHEFTSVSSYLSEVAYYTSASYVY